MAEGADGRPGLPPIGDTVRRVLAGAVRPLIFVDIDGVLVPFRTVRPARTAGGATALSEQDERIGGPVEFDGGG